MAAPPSPAAGRALGERLRVLRRHFVARRLLLALALALGMDLLYSLAAAFGLTEPLSFLAVIAFVLLAARDWRRFGQGSFGSYLDRRFGLKDRLYSFLQFQENPAVPPAIREAQAAECLDRVPFGDLARRLGRKVPAALGVIGPVWIVVTFLRLAAVYQGPLPVPGPAGRVSPTSPAETKPAKPNPGAAARETSSAPPSPAPKPEPSKQAKKGGQPGDAAKDRAEDSPAAKEALRQRLDRAQPQAPLESTRTTKAVAPPMAPAFEKRSTFEGERMKDARRFLDLLPRALDAAAAVQGGEIDILAVDPGQYPVKYRKQIILYYAKLRELTGEKGGTETRAR